MLIEECENSVLNKFLVHTYEDLSCRSSSWLDIKSDYPWLLRSRKNYVFFTLGSKLTLYLVCRREGGRERCGNSTSATWDLSNFQRMCLSKGNLQGLGTGPGLVRTQRVFLRHGGREGQSKPLSVLPIPSYLCLSKAGAVGCCSPSSLPSPGPFPKSRGPDHLGDGEALWGVQDLQHWGLHFICLGYPWRPMCLWSPGTWFQENRVCIVWEEGWWCGSAAKLFQSFLLVLGSHCTYTMLHKQLFQTNNFMWAVPLW